MSKMKAFAEKISNEMGYDGELNDEVLKEANRVLRLNGLGKYCLPVLTVPEYLKDTIDKE